MAQRQFSMNSMQAERNVVRLYAAVTFGQVDVAQVTFAALASTNDGDYFVLTDWTGGKWAIALDTTGGGLATPTGANWVAVPAGHKTYLDISGATTGSDVSGLVHTALLALSGFTTVITAVTSTTHQNCTAAGAAVVAAVVVKNKDDSGAGSITKAQTTAGTANSLSLTNSKGFCKLVQNAKGKYTLTLGNAPANGTNNVLDTYYKVLRVAACWDEVVSTTAPAAPLVFVTDNSVATAGTASFQLTTATVAHAAANPAATEVLRIALDVGNSNTY